MNHGVLIIEDEVVLAKKIAKYLKLMGFDTLVKGTAEDGLHVMQEFQPDAVVLDYNLPGELNGIECLKKIQNIDSGVGVIMITGQGNERVAVNAMKAGAFDYLSKPIILSELELLLNKVIKQQQLNSQLSYYFDKSESGSGIENIIGESSIILKFKEKIRRIIKATDRIVSGDWPTVSITGETGTGKELVARALHFNSQHADAPFIVLNVATIPNHLVESELFGYERGAFTDAHSRKLGLIESANGGSLFLDEIGEMDLALQAKLLRLIEDRTVRRLGSVRDQQINLQIITATNRNLSEMVAEGTFRQDLYYRLNTLNIAVPTLRERETDILLLANHFKVLFANKYANHNLTLSDSSCELLAAYPWPGNVRELRNTMEQTVLHCDGTEILPEYLNLFVVKTSSETHGLDSSHTENAIKIHTDLDLAEKKLIHKALNDAHGNVSKAARQLNITRDRLRYRIEKYHLSD